MAMADGTKSKELDRKAVRREKRSYRKRVDESTLSSCIRRYCLLSSLEHLTSHILYHHIQVDAIVV
jgi:hypothetical protein